MKIKRGFFTKTFIFEEKEAILLSFRPIKECISLWMHEQNKHLPEIKRIADYTYKMPVYKTLTKKDKLAYEQYQYILDCASTISTELSKTKKKRDPYSVLFNQFIPLIAEKYPNLANAFDAILDVAINYSSNIGCDFHQKNFSVKDGELVIRDPFVITDYLTEEYKYTDKKYHYLTGNMYNQRIENVDKA